MSDLISSLRDARKNPHRYLLDYLNLRSRLGGGILICVFEGNEDISVYDVWIRQSYSDAFEPLPVNGKENVLDLNVLLQNLKETPDAKILFFADSDFDGKKSRAVDGRVYFTPGYSIENLLLTPQTLEHVLINDLGLVNQEQPTRKPLIEMFQKRLSEFNQASLPANAYIRWMRLENIECTSLPESISHLVDIDADRVSSKFPNDIGEIANLFRAKATPLMTTLQEHISWLKDRDLTLISRGKFLLDFFKRFLSALYKDRRSEQPKYFARSDKTRPDPCHDLLRKLAGYTKCPDCLSEFLRKNLANHIQES